MYKESQIAGETLFCGTRHDFVIEVAADELAPAGRCEVQMQTEEKNLTVLGFRIESSSTGIEGQARATKGLAIRVEEMAASMGYTADISWIINSVHNADLDAAFAAASYRC